MRLGSPRARDKSHGPVAGVQGAADHIALEPRRLGDRWKALRHQSRKQGANNRSSIPYPNKVVREEH